MQRVLVTGATGVVGRAVVPRLVAAGYQVRALARSERNDEEVRRLGAEPVRADLFDPESLAEAVAGSDAVLHLATKIPPTAETRKRSAWIENDRIRAEGARNLVEAALAAGVTTVVYPSFGLVYPDSGDAWIDATTTPPQGPDILRSTLVAEAEVARFAGHDGRRGVSLRLALLYGPDAPSAAEQLGAARRGIALLPGAADAFLPMLWVDDAAAAIVAALERAPSGVYDVTDDEPLRRREIIAALARAVGRRGLLRPPTMLARALSGAVEDLFLRSQRVSNRRFKEATGWTPTVPSAREGLARLAASQAVPHSDPSSSAARWVKAGLAFMAVFGLAAGLWQQLAPRSFYDDFPGFGHHWVSVDGPYNEHLLRDVGGGNLGLAVVALFAVMRPSAMLVRVVAAAGLVAQVPHFVYHLVNVDALPTTLDQVAQTASLGLLIVVPALLLRGAASLSAAAPASDAGQVARGDASRSPEGARSDAARQSRTGELVASRPGAATAR